MYKINKEKQGKPTLPKIFQVRKVDGHRDGKKIKVDTKSFSHRLFQVCAYW